MAAMNTVPTIAEVMKHPAYPTAIWNLEPTQSGRLPVAEGRGGPFKLSWEIHGQGPVKIVLVMGLGSLKSAWQRQTLHFGHERSTEYSVLCLDNRGMGDSDKPLMRYSTSEMALDVLEVLRHVGWVSLSSPPTRTIHVIGISMGGMVLQELACLIPDRISSLSLCCTAAAIENTTTFWENMVNRASMLVPKSVEASVRSTARQLFPASWLVATDNARLPNPATVDTVKPPAQGGEYLLFETNYQRFAAQEMHKRLDPARFSNKGFMLQLIAAGWHRKTREQLEKMADEVGRERILVLHGTADGMISVPHGRKLIEYIKPATGIIQEGMGHAPVVEWPEWFHGLIEETIRKGEKLDGRPRQ
ncbi:Alpha/beta-hydrolase [Pleurostoma richardsiae]|uniref:Alpha/beta-hydrolase n=1 Tax=Pleurostoma richardsiae TaxID=41990 RepID=A0AA38RXT5_9PEZI|nr:Alpha/beta-hydrolase [Pleurostoma richardsiae]